MKKRTIIYSMKEQTGSYNLREFQDYHYSYDPLQYPLLFPFGTDSWKIDFSNLTRSKLRANIYNYYKIITRENI